MQKCMSVSKKQTYKRVWPLSTRAYLLERVLFLQLCQWLFTLFPGTRNQVMV